MPLLWEGAVTPPRVGGDGMVRQLSLALGTDPIATFASYIGPSQLLLEESVRDFLNNGYYHIV